MLDVDHKYIDQKRKPVSKSFLERHNLPIQTPKEIN